jgi:hypothetical protein
MGGIRRKLAWATGLGGAGAVGVAVLMMAMAGLASASAISGNAVYKCPIEKTLEAKVTLPAGKNKLGLVPVLDVVYTVANDEDSGLQGYWALDEYTSYIHLYQITKGKDAGTYFGTQTFLGSFYTVQGAVSPGSLPSPLTTEQTPGFGSFQGGIVFYINGTFTPGANPVTGSLGLKNFGGTTADLLKQTYGAGQTGPTSAFDWTTTYFAASPVVSEPTWGFYYVLDKPLQGSGTTNDWCNFAAGNTGDIVTAAA